MSTRKGHAADKYDTGKSGNADSMEDTKEGGCDHKGSLSQMEDQTDKPKNDLHKKESKGTCKHADTYK